MVAYVASKNSMVNTSTFRIMGLLGVKALEPQAFLTRLAPMNSISQGFLLGLANGVSCVVTCAPVLFPYLLSEGNPVRKNIVPLMLFLAGRLVGYLAFAVLAWEMGELIRINTRGGLVSGTIYAVIACMLIVYGFGSPSRACAASRMGSRFHLLALKRSLVMPAVLGLLTGLSLCPPFIAAIAGASGQASIISSLLFFFSFFIATSLYLLPFPMAGLLGRFQPLRITARLAAGIAGFYYLYRGLILIHGGFSS
jgi:sulfite exporter TauE/SafE